MRLKAIITVCAVALMALSQRAAADITVSGPAGSVSARNIFAQAENDSTEPWTVSCDPSSDQHIACGVPAPVDGDNNTVEIPVLIVVPSTGPVDSTIVVTISRGDQVIAIEVIKVHRTPHPADLNLDGRVDSADLTILLANWGRCAKSAPCTADIDEDGFVDGRDLSILLASWQS